jgi:hypothetical protein
MPRRLVGLALSWPQSGSRKITSVTLNDPTIWSGSSNRNPFELPSSSPHEDFLGTSSARTLNLAQVGNMFLWFNFNVNTAGGTNTFSLTTTWDDGSGGSVCSVSATATR